jgi:16S rRNA (guanine527-N7)-methyltransferase
MPKRDWVERVQRHGLALSEGQIEALEQYCFLVRKWSTFAAVVSTSDLEQLEGLHVVDSLSLVAPVRDRVAPGGRLLDIGSGGGFPAIPLAIVLTDREFVLMERSGKKVSLLRKVIGALGLTHVQLIHGSFPDQLPEGLPAVITARAVEKAESVMEDVLDLLPPACTFFCQSGDPRSRVDGAMFHVEPWEDEWTRSGARRGSLYLITGKG